jgi:BirA family biotin operon repressor/biotin-[acetyl-CoA-carboxylase] ligase
LTPRPWPQGVKLVRHEAIDSTNEEARRLALNGERGPLWIVAESQTAGRGRRGRAWVSERGNLFATLLMQPQGPRERWPQLGFAIGIAAAEMLSTSLQPDDVKLKWPNDVLAKAKKIAGILLETCGDDVLALGIGVNLSGAPQNVEFPATSLARMSGIVPDPEAALGLLAGRMHAWYEVWRERGFAPLKAAWLARAFGLGKPIAARLANEELQGVFEALDDDGALLLRLDDGSLRRVTAADVFFRA